MIKITSSFVTNISYKLQHIRTTMWKWWWNVFVCQSNIISHHIISHPANIFFLSCKQMSYLPTPLALGTLFVSFHGNTILVNVHVSTKIIKVIHFFQILMFFNERWVKFSRVSVRFALSLKKIKTNIVASYPLPDSLRLFVLKINENNYLGLVRDRLLSTLLNANGISIFWLS